MATALDRQPRVSRSQSSIGRMPTTIFMIGAAVAASFLLLTLVTGSHLFPTRTPSAPAATEPPRSVASVAPKREAPPRSATAGGGLEAKFSDLPLAVEPPNEPPRQPVRTAAPPVAPTGTLSTGLAKAAPPTVTELASVPSAELALPPPAPPPTETAAPSVGPPPSPRGSLPLQTDLIAPEVPEAGAATRRATSPAGGNDRPNASTAAQRRG